MNLSRYWLLGILLLGLAGCNGSSTPVGKTAAELIESGNKDLAGGHLEEALAKFTSAVEAQSDSAPARERRAAAYLHLKKFDQALNDCNAALRIDSKFASAYFMRGLVEKEMDNAEKASDDFGKALDNSPERVEVLIARGELYRSMAKAVVKSDEAAKYLEKALKDFDRAVKLGPRQAECRIERAAIYADLGDYESALADCEAALQADPKPADPKLAAAHVIRARGECELSEFDKAVPDCDAALSLDGNGIEAYIVRARARLEKSSQMRTLDEVAACRQAAADCRKAIDLSKTFQGDAEGTKQVATLHGLAHELRGSIYQNLRATKKALAEYERALALDPYLVSALLRRADTRSAAKDYAGALSDCNLAISIDSARAEGYSGRGMVYAAKQELAKAIEDFTQAVSLNHKCARAFAGRAMVYGMMAIAETAKAKELEIKLREGLAVASQTDYQKEIASCLEKTSGLRQKSIDDASQAIAANRHLASAYLTRGLAYGNQGVLDKALADFDAAIHEDPKMVVAYQDRAVLCYKQALVLAKLHDDRNAHRLLDTAVKDFEEASRLQPGNYRYDLCLYQCYKMMSDRILANQYFNQWEKATKLRQTLDENIMDAPNELAFKLRQVAEIKPDLADPLAKAQKELEEYLDATAEKD